MSVPGQEFKILVADDSPVSRKLVESTLSSRQYPLLLAKSGQEALDLFAQHKPAVVITDWMMPDLSGLELCQKIRADSQKSYTYIILLTSISEKESLVQGLAAGADDYLTKPFNPDELLARVGVGKRIIDLQRQIEAQNRQLEELALTDPLTGLPNRRAVQDHATMQLNSAARHGFPYWVAMADLDHFKRVNDTYGHEAGDSVLKRFAEILKANTRASDICGRMGGEEFILVMTYAGKENMQLVVERIRRQFEAEKFNFGGHAVTVTASFGVAGFEGQEQPDFTQIITRADAALYSAKRAGRNQMRLSSVSVAS
jgi:diguanylate cyclase (GGDEF)-like protein